MSAPLQPQQFADLSMPRRWLMGPGPSEVHPRVLRAMATPLVGHLDPDFLTLLSEIQMLLRGVMRTRNAFTLPISGTGSAGMEACLVNLIEPGDEILIGVAGVFGERMCEAARRAGGVVRRIDVPWGRVIEPDQVADELRRGAPKIVALVHAETSTGALQPLPEIGSLAREAGALFLVDAVTSLAGVDLRVDEWGIDAVYGGTQKCLSAPPGLSPVSLSPRACEALQRRKTPCPSWYLDFSLLGAYWGQERLYHHTAPITMLYALREALRLVAEEGLEARFERHRRHHRMLLQGLTRLGFDFVVEEAHRLPQLNAVRLPAGRDEATLRRRLLEDYGIEVGAGLGAFKGKVWRIGLMGESSTPNHVHALLGALSQLLD